MRKDPLPLIEVHQCTDIGLRRNENQDSMGYLQLNQIPYQNAHLLIVADGMGGASGGRVASTIAVEEVLKYFQNDPNIEPDVALKEAVEIAASAILDQAEEDPSLSGMGTTCVCILALNGYLFAAHVGDSRIYLHRNGKLQRLTRDHTAVQRLVEAGILTDEEAKNHPRQNVLSRVLGSEHPLYVELLGPPIKFQNGDKVLLCSDGLHGEISDDKIAEILNETPVKEVAQRLVDAAKEAGGNDNITVQVLSYGETPIEPHVEKWHEHEEVSKGYFYTIVAIVISFLVGYWFGFFGKPEYKEPLNLKPQYTILKPPVSTLKPAKKAPAKKAPAKKAPAKKAPAKKAPAKKAPAKKASPSKTPPQKAKATTQKAK